MAQTGVLGIVGAIRHSIFEIAPWAETYVEEMEEQILNMHAPNESVVYIKPIINLVQKCS